MRSKKLAKNYPVPQSREEADSMIKELGETRRRLERTKADMNDQLAKVKEKYEQKASPDQDKAQELMSGLEDWCTANRDEITNDGKVKFAKFGNGEVKWRTRPPRVSVRGIDTVLENLRALGLGKFIRIKEEINKDAILNEPDQAKGVAGITIGSEGEDFVVEPFEDQLSEDAA